MQNQLGCFLNKPRKKKNFLKTRPGIVTLQAFTKRSQWRGDKRTWKRDIKNKQQYDKCNSDHSIITLKVNGLNTQIKSQRLSDW